MSDPTLRDFYNFVHGWINWDGTDVEYSRLYETLDSWVDDAIFDTFLETYEAEIEQAIKFFEERPAMSFLGSVSQIMLGPIIDFTEVEYNLALESKKDLHDMEEEVIFYIDNILKIYKFPCDEILVKAAKNLNNELTQRYGILKKWNFYLFLNKVLYPQFLEIHKNGQEKPVLG